MSEFRAVMPFSETRASQRPFKRGRLSRDAGLDSWHSKRLGYSNFGNRRSLSGQRAFLEVG